MWRAGPASPPPPTSHPNPSGSVSTALPLNTPVLPPPSPQPQALRPLVPAQPGSGRRHRGECALLAALASRAQGSGFQLRTQAEEGPGTQPC